MFRRFIVLGWLCILTAVSYAQRINEILSDLAAPAQQSVLVVSHRGDWRNAPETHSRHSKIVLTWELIWLNWI